MKLTFWRVGELTISFATTVMVKKRNKRMEEGVQLQITHQEEKAESGSECGIGGSVGDQTTPDSTMWVIQSQ
jgi:hypothetical protein